MSTPRRPPIDAMRRQSVKLKWYYGDQPATSRPGEEAIEELDGVIAYIEHLEQLIHATRIKLEAGLPELALKGLQGADVPDA